LGCGLRGLWCRLGGGEARGKESGYAIPQLKANLKILRRLGQHSNRTPTTSRPVAAYMNEITQGRMLREPVSTRPHLP
jgi:hypothetical protein